MKKLFDHILANLRRVRPSDNAVSVGTATPAVRPRQVRRAAQSKVHLRLLSPADGRKLGLMTASLSTVIVAGFTGPALAQSEESCAFIYELRSPYTIERVLQRFPNDPCIPLLLGALSPQLLNSIDASLVAALPASQLKKVSPDVLEELGIKPAVAATTTTTRSVPRTTVRPKTSTTSNNNSSSSSSSSSYNSSAY